MRYNATFYIITILILICIISAFLFVNLAGAQISYIFNPLPTPTPTLIPITPTPFPSPSPVLTVQSPPPHSSASTTYLLDMDTDNILVDRNGTQSVPMASTTKIMTALIAIQTGNLNQKITITQQMLDLLPFDSSSAGLVVGETFRLQHLLYALMLPSGNDAAIAIALTLGNGSADAFVKRMNLFAHRMRLFQTHFTSPHGLSSQNDTRHYSSAADLARLAKYAMRIPAFTKVVSTPLYKLPATAQHQTYEWKNTNKLLASYKGMKGIKTGYTVSAGYCLVFMAQKNGHSLMGVILNSPTEPERNDDVTRLLNWGFSLPMLSPHSTFN